ncbi:MAG: hypothetical protein WAO15_11695 [Mycobacterium sp.]
MQLPDLPHPAGDGMTGFCAWCKTSRPPLTVVGWIEQATRPGPFVYACDPCSVAYRLIPSAEHPADSDGQPRRRPPVAP